MENLKKVIIEKVTSEISFIDEVTGNIDYSKPKDDCIVDIERLINKKLYKVQQEASIVLQEKEFTTNQQVKYDESHDTKLDYLTTVGINFLELEERAFSYRLGLSIINYVFIQIDPVDTLERAIELYKEFNYE